MEQWLSYFIGIGRYYSVLKKTIIAIEAVDVVIDRGLIRGRLFDRDIDDRQKNDT
jgi:hypothetical protein